MLANQQNVLLLDEEVPVTVLHLKVELGRALENMEEALGIGAEMPDLGSLKSKLEK